MNLNPSTTETPKRLLFSAASNLKRRWRALSAMLLAGALFPATSPAATPEAGAGTKFANSLALVEYELQYDKSDAPVGGLGAERCPDCGHFHGNDLVGFLKQDRPVEAAGYVLSPDQVLTKDPQLNPR